MLPKTGKEARAMGVPRYFTGVACKRDHLSERYSNGGQCVLCDNKRIKPKDQRKKSIKFYYENNKEKCALANQKWIKSSGMAYEYTKRSRAKNPAAMHFFNSKRHAAKLQRTPSWLNSGHWFEIECVYKYCSALRRVGLNYEVDHIVPLQGKLVSGLHAPWNFQLLTESENASKGNQVW
jgi:hypothetical protein